MFLSHIKFPQLLPFSLIIKKNVSSEGCSHFFTATVTRPQKPYGWTEISLLSCYCTAMVLCEQPGRPQISTKPLFSLTGPTATQDT